MKVGRPSLKKEDKKHIISISLPLDIITILNKLDNRSQFIEKAICEKLAKSKKAPKKVP